MTWRKIITQFSSPNCLFIVVVNYFHIFPLDDMIMKCCNIKHSVSCLGSTSPQAVRGSIEVEGFTLFIS